MNKRTNKKYFKKYLTDEEQMVLRLYHEAESIDFYKFDNTDGDAKSFATMLANPYFFESDMNKWYKSTKRLNNKGVQAIAFIDQGDAK